MSFINFWAARQKDSSQYDSLATKKDQGGKGVDFIFGFKEDGSSEIQSIHFAKDIFPTKQKVAMWLKKRKFTSVVESEASVVTETQEAQMDKTTNTVLENTTQEKEDNITEAGKRNSSADASTINKILQLLMGLVKKEDLEDATAEQMQGMCTADYKKPMNENEEIDTEEAWDGSKSRFSIDQLISSVPHAIAAWAKNKAGAGNQPTKADLHLPYKNPDGSVNPAGVSAALGRLNQVQGVPSDVLAAARKELEAADKKHKKTTTKESIEETEEETLVEWNKLGGEQFEETFVCSMDEAHLDPETGIVSNVDILGSVSKNNRRYSEAVQADAAPLFEGAKAYLNHQPGNQMKEARKVEDMIGEYRNVHVVNGKTKGDLHLIKDKQIVKEHVLPIVKDAPHLVGNSIVARGTMSKGPDGIYDVEKIIGVRSIDMVSEPATTSGLFSESITEDKSMELKDMTFAQLKEARPDLFEAIEADTKERERVAKLEKDLKEAQEQLVEKDKKIAEIELREEKLAKDQKVEKAIAEAKVPDSFRYEENTKNIKSHVRSMIERCATDDEMKTVIESWEQTFEEAMKALPEKKAPVTVKAVSTEKVVDSNVIKESDLTNLFYAFQS